MATLTKRTLEDRTARTQSIIDNYRGLRNEFERLGGVLCAAHKFDRVARETYDNLIDGVMIAKRMDELNTEAITAYRANLAAEG